MFGVLILITWLSCFLLRCGDIQPNPEPLSSSSSVSSISSTSIDSVPPLDSHLSICHLNIQNILPKVDILQFEMQVFDIFGYTETWLNDAISNNDLRIAHFKDPYRCDPDTRSGGVAIYVRDTLETIRRRDLEVKDLECVWIQVKVYSHNILVCGIYRPPNSRQQY